MLRTKTVGLLVTGALAICSHAYASLGSQPSADPARAGNLETAVTELNTETVYEVTVAHRTVPVLQAFADDGHEIRGPEVLEMTPQFDFKPLAIETSEQTALIDLGLAQNEQGQLTSEPNIYRIALSELQALQGRPINFNREESYTSEIATLVAGHRRGRGGAPAGRAAAHRSSRSTWCLRNVVSRFGGPFVPLAAMAYSEYLKMGWHSIGTDWQNAPANTVCLFGGGRFCSDTIHQKCGHAAGKLPNGMWLAGAVRTVPFPNWEWQKDYTFQGCVHK